jgi:hypothetical protein
MPTKWGLDARSPPAGNTGEDFRAKTGLPKIEAGVEFPAFQLGFARTSRGSGRTLNASLSIEELKDQEVVNPRKTYSNRFFDRLEVGTSVYYPFRG